jgi:hypothetical protein
LERVLAGAGEVGLVVVDGTVRVVVVVRGAVVVVGVVVVPVLGRVVLVGLVVVGRVVVLEGVTTVRVTVVGRVVVVVVVVGRVVVVVVGVVLLFPELFVLAEVTVVGFAVAGLVVVEVGAFTVAGAAEPLEEDPAVKFVGFISVRALETVLPEGVADVEVVVVVPLFELPLKLLPPPVVPAIWS